MLIKFDKDILYLISNYVGAFMKTILLIILCITAGCGGKAQVGVNSFPMVDKSFGDGPWQLVTYDDDKIFYEEVLLENKNIKVSSKSVYISNKSQFVYKDGTPIQTYSGNYLYWNKQGYVINKELQIIPEDLLFIVSGKPMPRNTPIKLRNYKPAGVKQVSNG